MCVCLSLSLGPRVWLSERAAAVNALSNILSAIRVAPSPTGPTGPTNTGWGGEVELYSTANIFVVLFIGSSLFCGTPTTQLCLLSGLLQFRLHLSNLHPGLHFLHTPIRISISWLKNKSKKIQLQIEIKIEIEVEIGKHLLSVRQGVRHDTINCRVQLLTYTLIK